ncbi:hypothetical protein [Sulfuricurvum sp.]|uniref:hypothetical protein n=1 Tax=Sulfuricurvum sp. TaxID=2025608 RepID=UPI0025F3C969|nr:hypothetical protein [Sulfuricurvum sp.]
MINDAGVAPHPPAAPNQAFDTVGGLHTATAFVSVNGIGDGWSEFTDDTLIFVSGAMSKITRMVEKQC